MFKTSSLSLMPNFPGQSCAFAGMTYNSVLDGQGEHLAQIMKGGVFYKRQ